MMHMFHPVHQVAATGPKSAISDRILFINCGCLLVFLVLKQVILCGYCNIVQEHEFSIRYGNEHVFIYFTVIVSNVEVDHTDQFINELCYSSVGELCSCDCGFYEPVLYMKEGQVACDCMIFT